MTSFIEAVQKIAANNAVRVYYVRGDSDHDMTEKMAKELFGDNVSVDLSTPGYNTDLQKHLMCLVRFQGGPTIDDGQAAESYKC